MARIIIGIYKIVNFVNGHCYIGSSCNINKRWTQHINQLNKGKHHSIYLQRAWNKYSSDSFKLEILEECNIDNLFIYEQKWIDKLKPEYNLGSVGGGDNISNHPNLDEIKKKHSKNLSIYLSKLSQKEYDTWTKKYGSDNPNWKGGSSKAKCVDCNTEIYPYHKRCAKCSKLGQNNPFYGKKHSDKTKQKISNRNKGKKPINTRKIEIDGVMYESQADAAKALGVSNALITYRLKKKYPNYKII